MRTNDGVDLRAIARDAMREKEFRVEFPPDVLKEAAEAHEPDFAALDVRDMSDRLWSSIDNDDSRDLDQAETSEEIATNTLRVWVAVANVNHFVPEGSAADDSALQNTTSIYTGVETFPMLPERFSTDLSSLNQGQKRLAVVVQMDITDARVMAFDIFPAVIQNKAQLAYDGVAAFLEHRAGPHSEMTRTVLGKIASIPGLARQLQQQDGVAQALRGQRFEEGALDFDTPELRPTLNADGSIELDRHESNRATQLIEEFMIAANKSVAAFLEGHGRPCIQRVVETPKHWPEIVDLAADHGTHLPKAPDGPALEAFLARQRKRDPDRFPDLSLAIIKLLGRGEYVVKGPGQAGIGHFGLAARDYLHGSAPNRRYPDVVDQRILLSIFRGEKSPYSPGELGKLADWCSRREQDAKKVERQVHKSIAAVALAPRVGETFDGFITGASEKGVFVRVPNPPVEGKAVSHPRGLKVGDKVRARLIRTDPHRGFIDFEVIR